MSSQRNKAIFSIGDVFDETVVDTTINVIARWDNGASYVIFGKPRIEKSGDVIRLNSLAGFVNITLSPDTNKIVGISTGRTNETEIKCKQLRFYLSNQFVFKVINV
jgi:hypothetical protein